VDAGSRNPKNQSSGGVEQRTAGPRSGEPARRRSFTAGSRVSAPPDHAALTRSPARRATGRVLEEAARPGQSPAKLAMRAEPEMKIPPSVQVLRTAASDDRHAPPDLRANATVAMSGWRMPGRALLKSVIPAKCTGSYPRSISSSQQVFVTYSRPDAHVAVVDAPESPGAAEEGEPADNARRWQLSIWAPSLSGHRSWANRPRGRAGRAPAQRSAAQ
jgi:hypothetical protein